MGRTLALLHLFELTHCSLGEMLRARNGEQVSPTPSSAVHAADSGKAPDPDTARAVTAGRTPKGQLSALDDDNEV